MRTLLRVCLAALVGALVFVTINSAIRARWPYDAGYRTPQVARLIWASLALGSAGAVFAAGQVRGLARATRALAGLAFPLLFVAVNWDRYDPPTYTSVCLGLVLAAGALVAMAQWRWRKEGPHVET